MSKAQRSISSALMRFVRGKRKSAAWNGSSTDYGLSSLKWNLLRAYDRLLRGLALAAMAIAARALAERKALKPLLAQPVLSSEGARFRAGVPVMTHRLIALAVGAALCAIPLSLFCLILTPLLLVNGFILGGRP